VTYAPGMATPRVHLPVLSAQAPATGALARADGALPADPLVDAFARRIRYLRVSVTDRCNSRCTYCMPGELGAGASSQPGAGTTTPPDHPRSSQRRLPGLARTIWVRRGTRFARWSATVPTNRVQATELFRQAGFYAFLRKDIPKVLGHNQLAATAYLVLIALLVVETITGLVLYAALGAEPVASLLGWVRELVGLQTLRLIHHLAMWAILAIAVFHIYSCILVDHIEKNGLMSSIVSGFKYPTREEVLEARDGGPELLEGRE